LCIPGLLTTVGLFVSADHAETPALCIASFVANAAEQLLRAGYESTDDDGDA
jgi:hypothetical protein